MIGTIGKAIVKDVAKNEVNKAVGANVLKSKTTSASNTYNQVKAKAKAPMVERNKKPRPPKLASLGKTYEDMEELEKAAIDWRDAAKGAIGQTIGAVGTALALRGAGNMYKRLKTERTWQKLKKENPRLTRDPKAREHFEVLQQFNPNVASNITTARSYMERMQNLGMVPHEFVGDLVKSHETMHRMGVGRLVEDSAKGSINTGLNYAKMKSDQQNFMASNKLQRQGHRLNRAKFRHGVRMDQQNLILNREKNRMQREKLDMDRSRFYQDVHGGSSENTGYADDLVDAAIGKYSSLIAKMEEAYV